jgi:hypothetical protein
MGLINIYLRTEDGRIIVLKEVGTSVLTVDKLKELANEKFDPKLNFANIRFLYRGKLLNDTELTRFKTNKMLFLDIITVEPKNYRDTELDVYLVKNTVAYPTELYPTGHEDSPFLRVGAIEYNQHSPAPLSMSAFSQYMRRVDTEMDNLLRTAKGNKPANTKLKIRLSELLLKKDVKGGSRKTKRRGGQKQNEESVKNRNK